MKKLTLILGLFLLFSCGNDTERVLLTRKEYNRLKGIKPSEYPKEVTIDEMTWDITLGSDGHEYCDNGGGNYYICFHYVDCKLCATRAVKARNKK
jgi:hypothetical protein